MICNVNNIQSKRIKQFVYKLKLVAHTKSYGYL